MLSSLEPVHIPPVVPKSFLLTSDLWATTMEHAASRPRTSADAELLWCTRNWVRVDLGGDRVWVTPGWGLLIPGSVPRNYILGAGSVVGMTYLPQWPESHEPRPTILAVPEAVPQLLIYLRDSVMPAGHRRRAQSLCLELTGLKPAVKSRRRTTPSTHLDRPTLIAPLPIPQEPALRALAEHLSAHPSSTVTPMQWAADAGGDPREFTRRFTAEVGTTFREWRLALRMGLARCLLAEGRTVSQVARAVGYRSTSAFVVAFRRTTGVTPGSAATPLSNVPSL